jgi:hypothetical protein
MSHQVYDWGGSKDAKVCTMGLIPQKTGLLALTYGVVAG